MSASSQLLSLFFFIAPHNIEVFCFSQNKNTSLTIRRRRRTTTKTNNSHLYICVRFRVLRLRRDIPNNQASDRFSLDVQFVAEKEKKKKKMNATDSHNTQSDAMQILALVSAIGLALNILNLAVFYLTPVHKVKPAYASAYLGTLYSTRVVLLLLFCQYFK